MPARLNGKEDAANDLRERLTAVGTKREGLEAQEGELRDETTQILNEARASRLVPMSEAARLVGLNRSTVYELYLDERDEDESAVGGSTSSRRRSADLAG